MKYGALLALFPLVLWPAPVLAEVTDSNESGFAVAHTVRVAVDPAQAYAMVQSPAKWWSKEHSWTGNSDNLYMDGQAGGCFCELIKGEPDQDGQRELKGSVQHMRILYAEPGRMLRLSGSLGPLQSEAVTGTMTILFKAIEGGTEISFDYALGGYMRMPINAIAPAVDGVIGEQASRLAMALGPLVGSQSAAEADASVDDDSVEAPELSQDETSPEASE